MTGQASKSDGDEDRKDRSAAYQQAPETVACADLPETAKVVGAAEAVGAAGGAGGVMAEPLSASLEDYLEAILQLERASRVTRVSEIAEQLSVSRPSVTGALKNLAARGLVSHEPYGHVTLTVEGTRLALGVERRHLLIRDFLTSVLEIPEAKAEAAACRLEHVLEPDVLAHFVAYSEKVAAAGDPDGLAPGGRS